MPHVEGDENVIPIEVINELKKLNYPPKSYGQN